MSDRHRSAKQAMSGSILVVDDEPDIRLMTRFMLEPEGFRVLEAPTGTEALTIVGREGIDLVLLDIRLPDLEGWEVLKRLRAADRSRDTPVVMMSAHSSEPTLQRAQLEGSNDYLLKPFQLNELLGLVNRLTG